MKKPVLLGFALLMTAQLAVPAGMIVRRELTLTQGVPYRFRTAPVDPYDPFRGRYVLLNFAVATVPVAPGEDYRSGDRLFARLTTDPQGYAQFDGLFRRAPEAGDFLRVRVAHATPDQVQLLLPFDRYYAEESTAPRIEAAYGAANRRSEREAHVLVKVRKGRGVLEELYIEGLPVLDFLRGQAAAGD